MKIMTDKAGARPYADDFEVAVLAAITDGADTFDAVRAHCGKSFKQMPDGWVHQVCLDNGIQVSTGM